MLYTRTGWLKLPVGITGIVQFVSNEETVKIGCVCVNDLQHEILLTFISNVTLLKIFFHSQYAGLFSL